MSYETNSVLSLNDFYDALITFMTANGWTLHDTITTRDKVLTSTGTDGKRNMTYRLTANSEAGRPYKDPSNSHQAIPQVLVRGYSNWDAGTNTGTGEFGHWGPNIVTAQNGDPAMWMYRIDGFTPPIAGSGIEYSYWSTKSNNFLPIQHDGFRKGIMWNFTGTGQFIFQDIVTAQTGSTNGANGSSTSSDNRPAWVHDLTTNKDYMYCLLANASDSLRYQRCDLEALTWTTLTAPALATNPGDAQSVWDGADTIYVHCAATTNVFKKYTISTATWTTLAVSPTTRISHTGGSRNAIFIPASVSGHTEDAVYMFLGNTTNIYRYNVTSNTWTTINTAWATHNATNGDFIEWDGAGFIYWHFPFNSAIYRISVTDLTLTSWVSLGNVQSAGHSTTANYFLNHLATKVRASNVLSNTYYFLGDADSMIVVTKVGTGSTAKYYWMYMGKYDTSYRDSVMTLTAGATVGVRPTVTVDSTAGFVVGETVTIYNPTTAVSEQIVIFDIPSGTTFRPNNLVNSYAIGSRVGVDPIQHILSGDCGFGCLPTSPKGYKSDYEQAMYHVEPILDIIGSNRGAPSVRGSYNPCPYLIFNPYSALDKYETLGTLRNVFSLPNAAFPKPQAEDILIVAGQQYKYFPSSVKDVSADTRGIVIGPIA